MSKKSCENYLGVGKKYLLSLSLCVFCTYSLSAQVTVGANEPAEKAALFQIKNITSLNPSSVTDISNASVDKDGGGLALPRVHLKSKTTLEPFVETTDADWTGALTSKIKEKHAGLVVYNLSTTGDFKQGMYIWDGAQWNIVDDGTNPTKDAWLLLGNTGTTPATNFIGTTDNNALAIRTNNTERVRISNAGDVGIGTTNPLATLHVEGDLVLADTPAYIGANVMVVDNNGNVGIAAPESPISKVLYVQSTSPQTISGANLTNLNAGTPVVVTWTESDVSNYGDLLTRNADNTFTFNEKALCEVSGYVNYQSGAMAPIVYTANWNDNIAALNVTVQYALSTSPGIWNDLTGVRHVFAGGAVGGPIQSVIVPAAIMTFNKDDKIRMVVMRPSATFGLPHGTVTNPSINIPMGTKFSKGFKVTTM